MKKKQLKELVKVSYKGNNLVEENVEKIGGSLSRKELKKYIKALKDWEKKITVVVTMSKAPTTDERNKIENFFNDKKIVYEIDPSLIAGIKIVNNDEWVYDLNVKNSLERMIEEISQTYE